MRRDNILRLVTEMAAFMLIISCSTNTTDMTEEMVIDAGWVFKNKEEAVWLPATVPGTVHTDLHHNGIIPDPFYGSNEEELQWIGEQEWIYKTEFTPGADLYEADNVKLIFEGLDTYATIYLNGEKVVKTDNMFRQWDVDCRKLPFGIRTLKPKLNDDRYGKVLIVELKGTPVFIKGANYIPQHSFVTKVSDSNYHLIISTANESNMNMLRVWGGGIYEDDLFYELCNRNGILAWQDFMFACAMYPGSDEFLDNVRKEAIQQVRRLRNHSNIALWCGNNEVDEGWNNWGWQRSYQMSRETTDTIWRSYKKLFHELLPEVVNSHDPQRFYLSTSPLHGWGRDISLKEGSAHFSDSFFHLYPDSEKIVLFRTDLTMEELERELQVHHLEEYLNKEVSSQ